MLGVVVHSCNSSYTESKSRKTLFRGKLWQNVSKIPYQQTSLVVVQAQNPVMWEVYIEGLWSEAGTDEEEPTRPYLKNNRSKKIVLG
jgi:hypothetical protein